MWVIIALRARAGGAGVVRKGRRYFHIPVGILVMKIFSVQSKQICR
jgi:hypothetical protein